VVDEERGVFWYSVMLALIVTDDDQRVEFRGLDPS
jgi:hypothetical protein